MVACSIWYSQYSWYIYTLHYFIIVSASATLWFHALDMTSLLTLCLVICVVGFAGADGRDYWDGTQPTNIPLQNYPPGFLTLEEIKTLFSTDVGISGPIRVTAEQIKMSLMGKDWTLQTDDENVLGDVRHWTALGARGDNSPSSIEYRVAVITE